MGYNLLTACHKCKTKVFHFRGEENEAILPFYKKHAKCAKENIDNVQTVMDSNGTDQDWESEIDEGGYMDDLLQPE